MLQIPFQELFGPLKPAQNTLSEGSPGAPRFFPQKNPEGHQRRGSDFWPRIAAPKAKAKRPTRRGRGGSRLARREEDQQNRGGEHSENSQQAERIELASRI